MLKILLYSFVLVLGFPTGILLAKLTKDEIKNWRTRLILIAGLSLIISIVLFFTNLDYKIPVIISLFFVIITNLTIIWKSL